MPVHDWTRVSDGIFHAFHVSWIVEMAGALNAGLLPQDYYCLPEQVAGPVGPDVLTLQAAGKRGTAEAPPGPGQGNGTTATMAPPRARFTGSLGALRTPRRHPKSVVIRHVSGDRIVAIVEVVSPGNKSNKHVVRTFLDKVITILSRKIHLLLIDLLPPGPRDPRGLYNLIAAEFGETPFVPPQGQPLLLASCEAGIPTETYVEAVGVGEPLPEMALFLAPAQYVKVPLEATYLQAWHRMPSRWRDILQPSASDSPE